MDMRYHWLIDRVRQKQFDVYWCPGKDSIGDYHTKHHPSQHHKDMCPLILHQANSLNVLGGCVKLPQPQPRTRTRTDRSAHSESQAGQSSPITCVCCNIPDQDYGCPIILVMTCLLHSILYPSRRSSLWTRWSSFPASF
jgi:hypothetical protein